MCLRTPSIKNQTFGGCFNLTLYWFYVFHKQGLWCICDTWAARSTIYLWHFQKNSFL